MVNRSGHEVESGFFTPRDYQIELLDKAISENVIVPLGTGSGKTFIAVLLIREFTGQLVIPYDQGGKRAVFLVDKVALVEQQASHIEHHALLSVGRIHGSRNNEVVDDPVKWNTFIRTHQVIVLTAQIFLDLLDHALFSLERCAVLIFDECHHALGRQHPYRIIMHRYGNDTIVERPRILGLTASVINNSTPKKLNALLDELEMAMRSRIEMASDLVALSKYGAKPSIYVIICEDYHISNCSSSSAVLSRLEAVRDFSLKCRDFVSELDVDPRRPVDEAFRRTIAILRQLGPWCAWKVCILWEKQLKKLAKQRLLGRKQVAFIAMGDTNLRAARHTLERLVKCVQKLSDLDRLLPSRVKRLFEILRFYNPEEQKKHGKNEPFCGIIFVEQRYVAYIMKILIKTVCKWEESVFGYLKCDFLIGYSNANISSGEDTLALHKRQEEVLRKFRQKHLNLLVSTSVLEEGVDVRHCNVVIRFDRPPDYRSFVQSKGRARKEKSAYFVLVERSNNETFSNDLRDFGEIEEILTKRYHCSNNPPAEMIDVNQVDELVQPYVVQQKDPKHGAPTARVTLSTAIALINRYCAKLPSDIFTRLVPQSRIFPVMLNGRLHYTAELILPINSPLKKAIRLKTPMETKKLAQMAVALEACQLLHREGELNDHLMPVGKDTIFANMLLDEDPDEWVPNMPNKIAKALHDALPTAGESCFIFVMSINLVKEASLEANPKKRKLHNPLDSERCFGFLSKKKIPSVPAFPLFLRQGQVEVRIVCARSELVVQDDTMILLRQFHQYIFGNILRLDKYGMAFNPEVAPANILVVPLRKVEVIEGTGMEFVLDLVFVKEVVSVISVMPRVPLDEERRRFIFESNRFENAVVMPWYRNRETPHYYYVAEIWEGNGPGSQFPDENYNNFNEYFITKYGIHIYNQTQPLLDVDYTSGRLNVLMPRLISSGHRAASSVAKSSRAKDRTESSQKQILVPELVDVHPISAELWNMIVALPSLLYRLNSLLLADELRQTIMQEALGMEVLPYDEEWPPLTYPLNLGYYNSINVDNNLSPPSPINNTKSEQEETRLLSTITPIDVNNDDDDDKEKENNTPATRGDLFDIGVWNPELGQQFVCQSTPLDDALSIQCQPNEPKVDEDTDTAGLLLDGNRLHSPGDLSDAEDDAVVLFDFMNRVQEHLGRRKEDFGAPSEDIVPVGWEVEETSEQPVNTSTVLSAPLVIFGASNAIFDKEALQRDLEHQINWMAPGESFTSSPSQSESTKQTANEPQQMKQRRQLYLDSMEMLDDCDRRPQITEQMVDLMEFVDRDLQKKIEKMDQRRRLNVEHSSTSTATCSDVLESISDLLTLGPIDSHVTGSRLPDPLTPIRVHPCSSSATSIEDDGGDTCGASPSTSSMLISSIREPLESAEVLAPSLDWMTFSFEANVEKKNGVSPCLLLQALTMSSAGDGINLERMETVGDSFLKYAVTDYLYHRFNDQHEGKLSFARSKEVSNCNLYRLGKRRLIPLLMVAGKFDPQDSWLPPCYVTTSDFKAPNSYDAEERDRFMEKVLDGSSIGEQQVKISTGWDEADANNEVRKIANGVETINLLKVNGGGWEAGDDYTPLPYNLLTQQNIGDKSIADSVEALIGAHLLELGPRAALLFMKWLGLSVITDQFEVEDNNEMVKSKKDSKLFRDQPLLRFVDTDDKPNESQLQLDQMWCRFQFSALEYRIGYRFKERAFLLQAFTHASYYKNRVTGCYQRLEFLGDAVLDYVITRFLFEHKKQYSPGVLTDLRSALVNNTIFASLAVKYDFHKHFVAMCPGLHFMIEKFVRLCEEKNMSGANFNEEMYMVTEEEIDEGEEEDIEVPKAMGDIFESVAGAVYLDSGRSLDIVWQVFYNLMRETIEQCCLNPPKSPIRELLELEPERARFAKLERIIETGKVRVTVDIKDKCRFTGMGRSYRIAKCTAAKRALRYLHSLDAEKKKEAARQRR